MWSLPWIIVGDFNEIISPAEKSGRRSTFINTGVNDWIQNNGLIDLSYVGQRFTWVKAESSLNTTQVRLDKVLANIASGTKFSEAFVSHIPRTCSEHSPVLLNLFTA